MNSGARTAAVHRTDRNRRAGGEHHFASEGRAGGTCRTRRSPCHYRGRRMNSGARTAAVPPEATAPTETDAQAGSIAPPENGAQAESFTPATEVAQAEPAAPEEAPAPTGNGA